MSLCQSALYRARFEVDWPEAVQQALITALLQRSAALRDTLRGRFEARALAETCAGTPPDRARITELTREKTAW